MEERTTGDGDLKKRSLSTDEYEVELPEVDETDEDLIGLSEEDYEKRRLEQERLREECAKMNAEGERLLKKGDFRSAESFFRQAAACCPDDLAAREGILRSVSENFQKTEVFHESEYAEMAAADESTRKIVLKEVGEKLRCEKKQLEEEAKPLKERFESAQKERRESFAANRKYYIIRFSAISLCLISLVIACGVSAGYITRTQDTLPVILTIAFGVMSVLFLVLWLFAVRGLLVAQRLCRDNERLSSTEDGARLEEIGEAILNLSLVLGAEEAEE